MARTFKGTDSEYRALHYWVERQLGKPQECENCGTTDRKLFGWANLSGEYKQDISDWARLCHRCHMWIDNPPILHGRAPLPYCIKGHAMTGANVRYKKPPHQTQRYCVPCQYEHQRNSKLRRKLKDEAIKALQPPASPSEAEK